jgi:hypothetical protein
MFNFMLGRFVLSVIAWYRQGCLNEQKEKNEKFIIELTYYYPSVYLCKTSYLNKEFTFTEPSPSVRFPCSGYLHKISYFNEKVNGTEPSPSVSLPCSGYIYIYIYIYIHKISYFNEEVNCTETSLLCVSTQNKLNEEVNGTEPSPSVSLPCS